VGKTTAKTAKKPVKKTTAKTKAKPKTTKASPKNSKKTSTGNLVKFSKNAEKKEVDESLIIPEKVVIDLNAYDWEGEELTEKQKLFVIWFSTPGTEYYHRAMKAARKAGYTDNTAHVAAHKMRNNPKIDKFIKKFESTIAKTNITETAQRWIQEKIIRGDYRVKDFYETVEYINEKTGEPVKKLALKNIEDLSDDQQLCIDGVDVKGQQGTMIYTLPDREKVRDSLISLVKKMEEKDNDGDDEDEETIEVILERLTVKKTIRQAKDETSRTSGLFRLPKNVITEL